MYRKPSSSFLLPTFQIRLKKAIQNVNGVETATKCLQSFCYIGAMVLNWSHYHLSPTKCNRLLIQFWIEFHLFCNFTHLHLPLFAYTAYLYLHRMVATPFRRGVMFVVISSMIDCVQLIKVIKGITSTAVCFMAIE